MTMSNWSRETQVGDERVVLVMMEVGRTPLALAASGRRWRAEAECQDAKIYPTAKPKASTVRYRMSGKWSDLYRI